MSAPSLINLISWTLLLWSTSLDRVIGFSQQKRVSVNLGLNDAEAVVGKIFRYKIPKDAFDGPVDYYQVTEAGGTTLQNWLIWYPQTSELVGIPGEQDSGPNYVQVTAIAISQNDKDGTNYTINESTRTNNRAKDIFSISVNDEYRLPANRIPFDQRMTCEDGAATTMTLNFGTTFDTLTTQEKIQLIHKVANTFVKDEGAFRLFSNNDDGFSSLKRIIHLASSTANASKEEEGVQAGTEAAITWRLNCESEIPTKGNDVTLDWLLAAESQAGYLRKLWGQPVSSWYVASITYEPRRRRRQASYVTPHSNIGATGPTWADDVTVTSIPTRLTIPTRTPTIRIRPAGFVTTTAADTTTSSTSRRTVATTTSSTTSLATTTIATTVRTRPTTQARTTTGTSALLTTKKPGDTRPTVKNSLSTLTCRRNFVCDLTIPPDTFHDSEDGDTSKLRLRLDTLGDDKKPWLVLDEAKQHLLGLPFQSGTSSFRLTAIDSGNRQVADAFSVDVGEGDAVRDEKLNHRISIHFTVPDEKNFTSDVKYKIRLIQKLAQYFGDRPENIRVNALSENGFTISWSNASLLGDRCPKSELRAIMNRLLPDGQVRTSFKRFMEPQFIIQKVGIEFGGSCASETTVGGAKAGIVPTAATDITNGTFPSATTTVVTSSAAAQDHFFISTILPAIIITVFLLVASLVACILYRRNRQNKKKGRAESKSEFVSKGAPVIFPDEMDLDKESTAATPMLLKDEKPPLQPLDFSGASGAGEKTHGNGAGNGAPLGRSPLITKPPLMGPGRALGKTHVSEAETELWQKPLLQDMDENPLYRPPPAFEPAGVKENRSPRPKHASPQQRDPPPYVPP